MASYKKEKRLISSQQQHTPTDLYEKPNNGKGFHLSVKAKCMWGWGWGGEFSLLQGTNAAFDKNTRLLVKKNS